MKKRILHGLLSLSLLGALTVSAYAAGTPVLTLDSSDSTVKEGESFTVQLELENNPGLQAIQLNVLYDDDLVTCTDLELGKMFSQTGVMSNSNPDNGGKASLVGISLSGISGDGEVASLTFRADAAGSCPLSIEVVRLSSDNQPVDADTDAVTIVITTDSTSVTPPAVETPDEPDVPEQPEQPEEETPASISFVDVPQGHWAYTYIQNAVKNGLFTGVDNQHFAPSMNVTRGMFVTVLYSSAGSPDVQPAAFSDVAPNAWYNKAVSWASQQGIVSGTGNNQFGPELSITREQLALILYQHAKGTSPGTEAWVRMFYPDGKDISSWALTAMSWALNEGLISGKAGNLLAPQDTATRAEVAVIMQNYMDLTK